MHRSPTNLSSHATMLKTTIAILLTVAALSPGCVQNAKVQALGGQSMGSTWSVKYVGTDASIAATRSAIIARLDLVDRQMSTWKSDSDLSRFNSAPASTWHVLPDELFGVLDEALKLAADTAGAYDPTVGPMVDLWGFGPGATRREPPDPALIDALRARVGWRHVQLDRPAHRAWQAGGVHVDLSSIAPGFAVDQIADYLQQHSIPDYLVEVGGELRAQGSKPDGTAWQVAIQRPLDNDTADDSVVAEHVVSLRQAALGSSGDYRHFFEDRGRRYAHRIDPRTGYPLDNGIASVTVMREHCIDADSLATALSVLGVEQGMDYANRHAIAALLIVRKDDGFEEHMTPLFAALLKK